MKDAHVAAHEHEGARPSAPGLAGEIDDLGHVGQVVQGEAHRLRPPALERRAVGRVVEDLQVEQADVVAGAAGGRGHALQAEGL
jgi:purine nucleoside phosphorylase